MCLFNPSNFDIRSEKNKQKEIFHGKRQYDLFCSIFCNRYIIYHNTRIRLVQNKSDILIQEC